eukprot:354263-Pleurochrysis_carterae.AAC.1
MQRDAAKLLKLPAKVASPRLQLTYFQLMVDQSSQFRFHNGDYKSNGQITNGLVNRGESRACSLRKSPFLDRVGNERRCERTNVNTIRTIRT